MISLIKCSLFLVYQIKPDKKPIQEGWAQIGAGWKTWDKLLALAPINSLGLLLYLVSWIQVHIINMVTKRSLIGLITLAAPACRGVIHTSTPVILIFLRHSLSRDNLKLSVGRQFSQLQEKLLNFHKTDPVQIKKVGIKTPCSLFGVFYSICFLS